MYSPPHPYGSSQTTGGILCGHALGNMINAADFQDISKDVFYPIIGKVLVYSSNDDPANLSVQNIKVTMFINHPITSSF